MTVTTETLCSTLIDLGYTFATGVPCTALAGPTDYFSSSPATEYVPAANEGAALGIASGAAMAGRKAVMFIQNSGLGNIVNPLTSLSLVYDIPCMVFVTHEDAGHGPQHRIMGETTLRLLQLVGVPHHWLPGFDEAVPALLLEAEAGPRSGLPAFVLVPPGKIGQYEPPGLPVRQVAAGAFPLKRSSATRVIAEWLDDRCVVASTGYIGRELFGSHDRDRNFYMQGSMGHAAAIGLGLALARPDREIVVIDGDGALLMHLGILSTIGASNTRNLTHIVLDNGAYETTGGQPTTAQSTQLEAVAEACGYRQGVAVRAADQLRRALVDGDGDGPRLIRVMISCEGHPKAGWATDASPPEALRRRFSTAVQLDATMIDGQLSDESATSEGR